MITLTNLTYPIPFTKMSGTGNDFIIIDHRTPFLTNEQAATLAKLVCRRRFSAGADGLILIETDDQTDFRWQFFNADGSRAEMCGNGARCAARYAFTKKIAGSSMRFRTTAGIIEAEMVGEGVKIKLTAPENLLMNQPVTIGETNLMVHSVNTGVPHAVVLVEAIADAPVFAWGRELRRHELFMPAGTNVNFVQVTNTNHLNVRTYERGVENETMACGTGAVASAIIASQNGQARSPVSVTTSGGETLVVHLTSDTNGNISNVFLEGPANFIYDGLLHKEAIIEVEPLS